MLKISKNWIISLLMLLIAFQMKGTSAPSSLPVAIIGGEFTISEENEKTYPYAVLINADHTITTLTKTVNPFEGSIASVAINSSGLSIFGGRKGDNPDVFKQYPYIGLVSPEGKVRPLGPGYLPRGIGRINSVAINDTGNATIGGMENSNDAFLALVSPAGSTSGPGDCGSLGSGFIESTDINKFGVSLFGGTDSEYVYPYVALVNRDGSCKKLSSLIPQTKGIFSVSIKDSGGIICGQDNYSAQPYVALISLEGSVKDISKLFPELAKIYSSAISSYGTAILAGKIFTKDGYFPYVALVDSSGTIIKELDIQEKGGVIHSVAMSPFGMAIIGGTGAGNEPYAAIVYPNGEKVIKVQGLEFSGGSIFSVDINSDGSIMMIGGQKNGKLYAAFVDNKGVIDLLKDPTFYENEGVIRSVSVIDN